MIAVWGVDMKLMMIMIRDEDREKTLQNLVEKGYTPTYIASTGDFLQYGKSIFFLGVEEDKVNDVKQIVDVNTKGSHIKEGEYLKAKLYIVDSHYEKIK